MCREARETCVENVVEVETASYTHSPIHYHLECQECGHFLGGRQYKINGDLVPDVPPACPECGTRFTWKSKKTRYSNLYKREISGCDACLFWRPKEGGTCKGWPGYDEHECPASEDGKNCPIYPE